MLYYADKLKIYGALIMSDFCTKPMSNRFKLDIKTLPAHAVDRYCRIKALIFFILAVFLIFFGIYELLNGLRPSENELEKFIGNNQHLTLISPTLFDIVLILIGVSIAVKMVIAFIKYKKIHFDGDFMRIIIRPLFSSKIMITEPLYLYKGVRLRTEFLQFGLLNKTRYIVELVHKDIEKTVPLYISTSKKNIRKIWEYYAKAFRLPAIIVTENDMILKDYHDLDLSIKEQAQKFGWQKDFIQKEPIPHSISLKRSNGKTIIKINRAGVDAYSIIAWICLFVFASLTLYAGKNNEYFSAVTSAEIMLAAYISAAFVIFYSVMALFRKDKLVIKKDKIVLLHKFIMFSAKNDELYRDKIEAVEVSSNPASGRSFISIISDNKMIVFGKKLPLRDLRWLQHYIISELIK